MLVGPGPWLLAKGAREVGPLRQSGPEPLRPERRSGPASPWPWRSLEPGRVDHHHHRQRRSGQRCHQRQFQSARSFQQHQGGTQVHHLRDQFLDRGLVVSHNPSLCPVGRTATSTCAFEISMPANLVSSSRCGLHWPSLPRRQACWRGRLGRARRRQPGEPGEQPELRRPTVGHPSRRTGRSGRIHGL